jgi:hypothetical protein
MRRKLLLLDAEAVAEAFGYTAEQLKSIPAESHMGLSCGNPVAMASIKEACYSRPSQFTINDKFAGRNRS